MSNITWKKLREEEVKIGYRTIFRKYFTMPNGAEAEWTTMERVQSACIMPVLPDGRIVCATQFRPGPEKICTELPGGLLDPNETPQQAAARELLEETGYAGDLYLLASTPLSGLLDQVSHHFLAINCHKVAEPQPGEHEFINIEILKLDTFMSQVYAGNITDSATALFGLLELQKRGLA